MKKQHTLLVLLLVSIFFAQFSYVFSSPDPDSSKPPVYSWKEENFDYTLHRDWDGESTYLNYSGSIEETYENDVSHGVNFSDHSFTQEFRTTFYKANYSFFQNSTVSGSLNISLDLDTYRVDISQGDSVNMIWLALKQGIFDYSVFYDYYNDYYIYFEEFHEYTESTFCKYDLTTRELLSEWNDTSDVVGVKNVTSNSDPKDHTILEQYTWDFTAPLVLVMQLFKTENKDRVAWADYFNGYHLYKDEDSDSIYSAGETTDPTGGFNLYGGDEHVGWIQPIARHSSLFLEYIYPEEPHKNITHSSSNLTPNDKTIEEMANTIVFNPPTLTPENVVEWDIEYPGIPLDMSVIDHDKSTMDWYFSPSNTTYANCVTEDIDYGFKYNISEGQANLDFTMELSKITDNDSYDALQGYGLTIPHFNYFLSSFDINEVDPVELSAPSDMFIFESNGSTVAEINMFNPKKKNYTLFDYPIMGVDSEFEARGGSVHKILASHRSTTDNNNPMANLIYSIEELVEADTEFIVADDLYRVETQNYPVWNGEHLVHDPRLTIYYDYTDPPDDPPELPPTTIPGFNIYAILAILGAVVLELTAKIQKKTKI